MWYCATKNDSNFLAHQGILGQKWGVRRFQNEDGSLTPEGIKRYRNGRKSQETIKFLQNTKLESIDDEEEYNANAHKFFESKAGKLFLDTKEIQEAYRDRNEALTKYGDMDNMFKEDENRERAKLIVLEDKLKYDVNNFTDDDFEEVVDYSLEKVFKAQNKFMGSVEKYVDDVLGEYGDKKIMSWKYEDYGDYDPYEYEDLDVNDDERYIPEPIIRTGSYNAKTVLMNVIRNSDRDRLDYRTDPVHVYSHPYTFDGLSSGIIEYNYNKKK